MQRPLRLTSSRDYDRVFRLGHRASTPLLTAVVLEGEAGRPARVGLAVGAGVGNAVRRNRAKRILREAVRAMCVRPGTDVVLVAKPEMAGRPLRDAVVALETALDRAGARC